MAFEPGLLVTPSVRLVEQLGEGGMGEVWIAEHLKLEARVAVKFILPGKAKEREGLLTRFRREASVAAKLTSPHVVRIFDYGVLDEHTPFMVMELLRGEPLSARIKRLGSLGMRATVAVVTQTAKVLSEAHRLGVVHRDIKPDNLFLLASSADTEEDDEVFVKVLDFGVAKSSDGIDATLLTQSGAMVGTPVYMSPEQLRDSKAVDHRVDLWALGVVAYECLTGNRPFRGDTILSLATAICEHPFDPPSGRLRAAPPELDVWFDQALHKQSDKRFASAKALSSAFARAAGVVLSDSAPALSPRSPSDDADTATVAARMAPLPTPTTTDADADADTVTVLPESIDVTVEGVAAGPWRVASGDTELPLASRRATQPPSRGRLGVAVLVLGAAVAGFFLLGRDEEPPVEPPPPPTATAPLLALAPAPSPAPTPTSSATEAPATPSASAAPSVRIAPRTAPPPPTVRTKPDSAKPDFCKTAAGFTLDANGDLVPKPECL